MAICLLPWIEVVLHVRNRIEDLHTIRTLSPHPSFGVTVEIADIGAAINHRSIRQRLSGSPDFLSGYRVTNHHTGLRFHVRSMLLVLLTLLRLKPLDLGL